MEIKIRSIWAFNCLMSWILTDLTRNMFKEIVVVEISTTIAFLIVVVAIKLSAIVVVHLRIISWKIAPVLIEIR